MPSAKYTVRVADLAQDRETVLELWRQAFPAPGKHPIKYDWCYGPTPQGRGRLYLLVYTDEARVIGVQGIIPRHWWSQGIVKPASICADLVVDQHHRSIGPALALVRQVVELEQDGDHTRLLYGFPNLKSEALYRRAGYSKMGVITRYARPLRLHVWLVRKGIPSVLAAVLGKLADLALQARLVLRSLPGNRRWNCVSVSDFDARFDDLWSRVASRAIAPMVVRNAEYLRWRFGNHFAGETRVMVLERQDGQIDAYVVYLVDNDKLVTVLDFLAVDNDVALMGMLSRFARVMYRQGYVGIMLEFSGPAAVDASLRHCAFSARESHPVYAVFGQFEVGWQEGTEPYFTSSDRDQ